MNHNPSTTIEIDSFPGRKHFRWFLDYDDPTYGMTVEMNLTKFYSFVKKRKLSTYLSLIYLVTCALNQIKEFRYRYQDGEILLFEKIDPAFTIMTNQGLFDNVDIVDLGTGFKDYLTRAQKAVDDIKLGVGLSNPQIDDRVDQYYFTCLPWISFKALTQPMTNNEFAFIPRIAWDKFVIDEDKKVICNFNIIVHHALIDGYPLSQGFIAIQDALNNPERYFVD